MILIYDHYDNPSSNRSIHFILERLLERSTTLSLPGQMGRFLNMFGGIEVWGVVVYVMGRG